MLEELRIRSLGVIDDAVLELGPGLNVLTGETGAGKTMVVTALGLLLGHRADTGAIRAGAGAALVEGRVLLDGGPPAAVQRTTQRVHEAEVELDDGALLMARSVSDGGRSRAHLGGRAVPVGLLAEVSADLVAVHGQADQAQLRSTSRQREVLDAFAGPELAAVLAEYRDAYTTWQRFRRELAELTERSQERALEADLLRAGLGEVERVQPLPGEDVALRAEAERLEHAEELRFAAATAHEALVGPDEPAGEPVDVTSLLTAARRAVAAAAEHDPALADLEQRIGELGYLAADAGAELASYTAAVDADPARLATVQERRAALAALTRARGCPSIEDVLDWADRSAARLSELEDDVDRRDGLAARVSELATRVNVLAAELSAGRRTAALRLQELVQPELAGLAMPDARLEVHVDSSADPGPHGADEVEFLLLPHQGAPARPLTRGASGGELSRVMLALEVVLAGADPVPTFVFDEVDAGVGGRAAVEVGRRLARLGRDAQVIVVTHLPQVAAFADRHLVVVKQDGAAVTASGVTRLDDAGRVRELARMLAGQEHSGTAQAHAEELLAGARAWAG